MLIRRGKNTASLGRKWRPFDAATPLNGGDAPRFHGRKRPRTMAYCEEEAEEEEEEEEEENYEGE